MGGRRNVARDANDPDAGHSGIGSSRVPIKRLEIQSPPLARPFNDIAHGSLFTRVSLVRIELRQAGDVAFRKTVSGAAGGFLVSKAPFVAGGIIDGIVSLSADNAGASEPVCFHHNAFIHIAVIKRNDCVAVGNLEPLSQSFEPVFQAADLLFDSGVDLQGSFGDLFGEVTAWS